MQTKGADMLTGREYSIDDDEDGAHLALIENGVQVGGALFPVEFCGDALSLAREVGEAFRNNSAGHTIH